MKKRRNYIFGLGISGKAVARELLSRSDQEVIGIDKRFQELSCPFPLVGEETLLEGGDRLIVSPGIPWSHPTVMRAQTQGMEVISEIEFAFSHLLDQTVIGITGTNGKTSAVLATTHLFNAMGKKARALGNVGFSLSGYLSVRDREEILIVELSSFQLERLSLRCLDWAIVLNISPNHLDRHASMEEYVSIKLSIRDRLKKGGEFWVGSSVDATGAFRFEEPLSIALGKQMGWEREKMEKALLSFQKPPHRIEWVADIDGVSYYNDSKSSNVDSVLYGIERVKGPIVLIVGGVDKNAPYAPWIVPFQRKVKQVIAYGAAAEKIGKELSSHLSLIQVGPFEEAVAMARRMADPGDTVLLSPGCSSYDQFRNFEERGEKFKQIIEGAKIWIGKKPF